MYFHLSECLIMLLHVLIAAVFFMILFCHWLTSRHCFCNEFVYFLVFCIGLGALSLRCCLSVCSLLATATACLMHSCSVGFKWFVAVSDPKSASVRYLGIQLDKKINWKEHSHQKDTY
jgi:hypothetical protein